MKFDGESFGKEIVKAVAEFVEAQMTGFGKHLDSLDERLTALALRVGGTVEGADPEAVATIVTAKMTDEMAVLRRELAETRELLDAAQTLQVEEIARAVEKAVAALPPAAPGDPGTSVTLEDVAPVIAQAVEKAVAALPAAAPGEPGTSVTLEDVEPVIAQAVEKAVAALPAAAPGEPGTSVTLEDVEPVIAQAVEKALAALPAPAPGEPGTSVTLADVEPVIAQAVEKAVAALPAPTPGEPGTSVTLEDVEPVIAQAVEKAVAALPAPVPGEPGTSVTLDDVEPVIAQAVEKAVAALPAPVPGEPGTSVTLEDVAPVIAQAVEKAVAALPAPKDGAPGVGVAGAVIDRDHNLTLTLSNGETVNLGLVVGKDADMAALEGLIAQKIAALPPAKDGFGFEDLSVEMADDGRTMVLSFTRGEDVKEFRLPLAVVLDRGVFKEGNAYQAGDGCTWAGSFWIAQTETKSKPGEGPDWRLSVKKGRDGKDLRPPPGPSGPVALR